MLSMGSLELLLRASVFAVLDLNEMGHHHGRYDAAKGGSRGKSVWAGKLWLMLGVCLQLPKLLLKKPAPYPKPLVAPFFHSFK